MSAPGNAARPLGRYVLIEPLGRGGMGEVFRARDRLGGEVALKRLAQPRAVVPGGPAGPQSRSPACGGTTAPASEASAIVMDRGVRAIGRGEAERYALANEFQLLASVRHPNVVEVLDYGFDEDARPYFTMQLLGGARTIVDAAAGASLEVRARLLLQLLSATRYLHRRGVLHRDLKPSNVLVVDGDVKVLDFGLSHLVDASAEATRGWGTAGYVAPELALGHPPSERSDLFAVGVIARQLFPTNEAGAAAPIDRLAAAAPDERFASADEAITALRALFAGGPSNDRDAREPAFEAPPLVGRHQERALLRAALEELWRGRGGACLLEGESGIGKSRLLDDLRTGALVGGALVLSGQAVREGGRPYQLFSEALRRLILEVEVRPAEADALRHAIPDVERLLGVPVAPIAARPDVAADKLSATVELLLGRVSRPVVLVLDDLQWARGDSLGLLPTVLSLAERSPLLVVAARRDDERATRPEQLERLPRIVIDRLSAPAIEELAQQMLGAGAGTRSAEALTRDTEGNPFFLVEMIRDLLGAAGGAAPAPSAPRRIDELVHRRLAALPAEDRPIVSAAAVAGRNIDAALLRALFPTADLEAWVGRGLAAGVLHVRDERLRIAHDKLREGALAQLSREARRALHQRIGEALEQRPEVERDESARLAHHFSSAGDRERTVRYGALAGERALATSAHAEAIHWLRRALDASDPVLRVSRGRWMRLIADAHYRIGEYDESARWGARAAQALGSPSPSTRWQHATRILGDVVRICVGGLPGLRPRARPSEQHLEVTRAYMQLGETHFYLDGPDQLLELVGAALRSIVLAERSGQPAELAHAYAGTGFLVGTAGLHLLAERWLGRAASMAEGFDATIDLALILHRVAIYRTIRADWHQAAETCDRACAIAHEAGARRQWEESATVRAIIDAYRGRFREGHDRFVTVWRSARDHGDGQAALWGSSLAAWTAVRLDLLDAAPPLLDEAATLAEHSGAMPDRVNLAGPRALLALRLDDRAAAERHALTVLDKIDQIRLVAYWTYQSLDAAIEVLQALVETEEDPAERARIDVQWARAIGQLRRYGKHFPFAHVAWLRARGGRQRVGRDRRAEATLRAARREARRHAMAHDEARTLVELGRLSSDGATLKDAARRLRALGAVGEARIVDGLIATRPAR